MRPKIVLKFGGTSLATPESWRKVLDIIESKRALNPVVVVSAVGSTRNRAKVTDLLQGLSKDPKLGPLQEIHDGLLESLGLATDLLQYLWKELAAHLQAKVSQAERLDRVMGWGERLSARMMAAALRSRGWDAQDFSPAELATIVGAVSSPDREACCPCSCEAGRQRHGARPSRAASSRTRSPAHRASSSRSTES